jgi:hypothetical protein
MADELQTIPGIYFTRTARPRPELLKWWNWRD